MTEDDTIERLAIHREVKRSGMVMWSDELGRPHRINGPAIVFPNGSEQWYRHGELHREGGPAMIWVGDSEAWFQNGVRHREDGPAYTILKTDIKMWWIHGEQVFDRG